MINSELMYILKSEIRLHIILSLNEFPKSPKELTNKNFYISHYILVKFSFIYFHFVLFVIKYFILLFKNIL